MRSTAAAAQSARKRQPPATSAKKKRSASVQSARKVPQSAYALRTHRRQMSDPELSFTLEDDDEDDKENASFASEESTMTVAQLQDELRRLGAKVSGRKNELIERLRDARLGKIERFGRYDVVIVPNPPSAISVASKGSDEAAAASRGAAAIVTTTSSTSVSGVDKQFGLVDPSPTPGPSSGSGAGGLGTQPPGPPAIAAGIIAGSPAPALPPSDTRLLRVQYPGKPAETIKFDLNDKAVVESVAAMLRNLFPDQKVHLDPKLDIEPVYLMDEYAELHVVTKDFLACCPTPNDPPGLVYQARKGPLPSTIDDVTLNNIHVRLAIVLTILQFLVAHFIFSSRFLFGSLPHIGSLGFIRALHDWVGFGYPASIAAAVIHAFGFVIASAYISPVFRIGLKVMYPRFRAFQVDTRKAYTTCHQNLTKRRDAIIARILGYGRPLPARMGLGVRACWFWLVTKRYFTSNLAERFRNFLPEGMLVTFASVQLGLSTHITLFLLVAAFVRPRFATLRLLWEGEVNAEAVVGEMIFQSLAIPGFATNLNTVPLVGAPVGLALIGKDDVKLKIKWNSPLTVPEVMTISERSYSVGVSRYIVAVQVDGRAAKTLDIPAPQRDWFRMITIDEAVFGVTFLVQSLLIHPALGSAVALATAYACFTASQTPFKSAGTIVELLRPNTEYTITVTAVDDLDRKGATSVALIVRTKPRSLFRRLLLASEEVPINAPVKPSAPAGPAVSVTVGEKSTPSGSTPAVSVVGGATSSVSVASNPSLEAGPTAIAVAFPAPPPPPPPAPSATRGHIRYAGVVWNLAMDERETELFLRTMRSAMLPDPRKEKFEADLVFSTESKTTHQVVAPSYLRALAATSYDSNNSLAWYKDPLMVAHPAGTRHTFAPGSIYSHMVLSPKNVDRLVALFIAGSILSLAYSFVEAQTLGTVNNFWNETYVNALRTLLQMIVFSNPAVLLLKQVNQYGVRVAQVLGSITAFVRSIVKRAVGYVFPEPAADAGFGIVIQNQGMRVWARTAFIIGTAALLGLFTLILNGAFSFTGVASCLTLLGVANAGIDGADRQVLQDSVSHQARQVVGPILNVLPIPRRFSRLLVTGVIAVLTAIVAYILLLGSLFWTVLVVVVTTAITRNALREV